jgi:hypothetical protein
MKLIKYICFILILISNSAIKAQKNLPTDNVEIVKNFDAKLANAERAKLKPVLPNLDTTTKPQQYNLPSKSINVDYPAPKLRPLAMKSEKLPDSYDGYAKLGYGLPNQPFGELGYRFGEPKVYDINAHVLYHALDNTKSRENQQMGYLGIDLDGTYYSEANIAVDAKVNYNQDTRYLYGYKDASFLPDAVKQSYDNLGFGARLYNKEKTSNDFGYEVGLNFNRLQDNFSRKENNFIFNASATKWLVEKNPLTVNLKTDLSALSDTGSQSLNNIFLQPNFTWHADAFKVKIGLNLISANDNFKLYPDVEVAANILENKFLVFGGWKGDAYKNNYYNQYHYNPFVSYRSKINNTNSVTYYGGIKGNLNIIEYTGQIGYTSAENLALYQSDTNNTKVFKVLYDTVQIFNIKGGIVAHLMQNLTFTGTIGTNAYTLKKESKAWGLPAFDINAGLRYAAIPDKLMLKGGAFIQDGVSYRAKGNTIESTGLLMDISFGAEYTFHKNFGAFIDINNLANNKRERWALYNQVGLNFIAGITARF